MFDSPPLKFASRAVRLPLRAYRAAVRAVNPPKDDRFVTSLLPPVNGAAAKPKRALAHLAVYTDCNAGDTLIPVTLRDLFDAIIGPSRWHGTNLRRLFGQPDVAAFRRSRGIVLGGGGLFLSDTNPNENSGWQWNCPIPVLRAIDVPIALFAVGYNRFRGQADFAPVFREHLTLLAEKCVYIGLRNTGSITSVAEYLPESLHEKLRYQPCMTTLLAKLYPHLFTEAAATNGPIAINCAFDRKERRFGAGGDRILASIAKALGRLAKTRPISFFAHMKSDEEMLPVLDEHNVPYDVVRLYKSDVRDVVAAYRSAAAVIGMRGHAQLIAYGCRTPVVSLASHEKLRWFCRDVELEDLCVDVNDPSLEARLVEATCAALDNREHLIERIRVGQERLWNVTEHNVLDFAAAISEQVPTA